MPSIRQIVGAAIGLLTVASALPAQPKMNQRARRAYEYGLLARNNIMATRQINAATGLPDGLTDIDILEL
jgi:hypothetical protein